MMLQALGEILGSVWTVWAVALFGGIAFWAWRPSNRARFERDGRIPLNDDR